MSENLYKTDTNVVLRFFEAPEQNNFLAAKAGTPVYDSVLSAEVIVPGQAASTLSVEIERTFALSDGENERRVRRTKYYDLYKAQVEAYKSDSGENVVDGTPIRSWPSIDTGTAQTLIAQGVFTVEALADLSDTALSNIGFFGRTLREQAKAYLTAREFGIPSAQMAAEVAELRDKLNSLETENANLKQLIKATENEVKTPKVKASKPDTQAVV